MTLENQLFYPIPRGSQLVFFAPLHFVSLRMTYCYVYKGSVVGILSKAKKLLNLIGHR